MKVLQIEKDGVLIPPKILESGVDFDTIYRFGNVTCLIKKLPPLYIERLNKDGSIATFSTSDQELDCEVICYLSDCYQERPLIEIDGFCEFDILQTFNDTILFLPFKVISGCYNLNNETQAYQYNDIGTFTKLGSIFKPENQQKYPEIYQEALKSITNN